MSDELRVAVIVSSYKSKGETSDCSNYRSIILLSVASKIFATVLLERLIPVTAEDSLQEGRCSFRENRGTADIIFALSRKDSKENAENKTRPPNVVFVDLTKAFDTVSQNGLWKILKNWAVLQNS